MVALRRAMAATLAVGATALIPTIEIHPGVYLPQITLGGINATWVPQYPDVSNYSMWIEIGERGFDTAWEYDTGGGIRRAIEASGLKRSEIFITHKIPESVHGGKAHYKNGQIAPTFMPPELVRKHVHENLELLGTTYVDLLLMHTPMDFLAPYPYNATKETADVYRVMEESYFNGSAKALGVSNFKKVHFDALLQTARIKPVINQANLHLGGADWETIEYCANHSILYQGYSVLHYGGCDGTSAADSPTVTAIAQSHNVSVYEVQLRWMTQMGMAVVACSDKRSHMLSDIHSLEFNLTEQEMDALTHCTAKKESEIVV